MLSNPWIDRFEQEASGALDINLTLPDIETFCYRKEGENEEREREKKMVASERDP